VCASAGACSISSAECWSTRTTVARNAWRLPEFDLLKIFTENPNRPLMRDWLLEVTAHREPDAFDRAIDLRITRLRRKVEIDPAHPEAIRTVRGVGYMFVPAKD
jgi:two-component system phosphate regulon response regulator OmpR